MFKVLKSIFLVCIVILALASVFFIYTAARYSSWLYNYQAYTGKTLVANVTVSAIEKDDKGQYMNITYKPVALQSALLTNLNSDINPQPVAEAQTVKVYGDTVHIGGPIIKIYDSFRLLKTKTLYKVATIYGKYNLDATAEANRSQASFNVNGGIDETYQYLNQHISEWPYNQIIQSMEIDTPGVFGSQSFKDRQYQLYITDSGFSWEMVQ